MFIPSTAKKPNNKVVRDPVLDPKPLFWPQCHEEEVVCSTSRNEGPGMVAQGYHLRELEMGG
jgi:hypothetical protein